MNRKKKKTADRSVPLAEKENLPSGNEAEASSPVPPEWPLPDGETDPSEASGDVPSPSEEERDPAPDEAKTALPADEEESASSLGEEDEEAEEDEEEQSLPPEGTAPLMAHLMALRRVFIVSLIAVAAAFFLVYYLAIDRLMSWITAPIVARGVKIIYTAMSEALMTKLKVTLIAAVIAASPVIIGQIWGFIKPALYPKEKKAFRLLFFVALVLFLAGVAFCCLVVAPFAIDFFIVAGEDLAEPLYSIEKYVSFLFGFVIPFGIAFLLPVALYLTTRIGLTNYSMLASKRKFVVFGVFILAAVLTPPDVVSQLALGLPMVLLYEIGIQACRLTKPRERE